MSLIEKSIEIKKQIKVLWFKEFSKNDFYNEENKIDYYIKRLKFCDNLKPQKNITTDEFILNLYCNLIKDKIIKEAKKNNYFDDIIKIYN